MAKSKKNDKPDRRRVFVIIMDSLGAGELPDAADFGDVGANTMRTISRSPKFRAENLRRLGLGCIDGLSFLEPTSGTTTQPLASTARLAERSRGKDTTIGHWELMGVISPAPMPTYPNGFPQELVDEFARRTGRGWLVNKPYSGTEVIKDYGEEHMRTGRLIVYTSADSVFQIAAHEEVVPLEELYEDCRIARELLCGEHAVGRVIARPFVGSCSADFTRTTNRHDFSRPAPSRTALDAVAEAGLDSIAVGKINDIFCGRGITESIPTKGNADGLRVTLELAQRDFEGLCFVNLVDFDALYGHRQDVDGYAAAVAELDAWLPSFLEKLGDGDLLILTADHGCDPGDMSTDHTREYIPVLMYGKNAAPVRLGTRSTFADVGATVADWLGVEFASAGTSLLTGAKKVSDALLVQMARSAMAMSYAPYSGCNVGAALLTKSGQVFTGCNIENAAFSPSCCAERTAFFKAVSEGFRDFEAIAVAGGRGGVVDGMFAPCGVCRQVMAELCDADSFRILLVTADGFETRTLRELLPLGFSKSDVVE